MNRSNIPEQIPIGTHDFKSKYFIKLQVLIAIEYYTIQELY